MFAAAGALIGLSPRGSNIVASILGVLALCAAVFFALNAYGKREYAAGRTAEKQVWLDAEADLKKRVEVAKTEADVKAAQREAVHAEQVRQEREEIDEAVADGRSPLDVLFPSGL